MDAANPPLDLHATHAGHPNVQNQAIQAKGRKRFDLIYEIPAARLGFGSLAQ